MKARLKKLLYSFAWDTRCRNKDVSRLISSDIRGKTVLDVGCGDFGLAAFNPGENIIGIDVPAGNPNPSGTPFVYGSILELPFAADSFDIVTSVDVLEHLPEHLRERSIRQLVKVARRMVVITFPAGEAARKADEDYHRHLIATGQEIPDWLDEHLRSRYPDAEQIARLLISEAEVLGKKADVKITFSESLSISRFLRWSAGRSKYLYLANNLAAGALVPVLPRAAEKNAYRAMVSVRFANG